MIVAAQAVTVRAVVAPDRFFQGIPAHHMGALLHQHCEQL